MLQLAIPINVYININLIHSLTWQAENSIIYFDFSRSREKSLAILNKNQ